WRWSSCVPWLKVRGKTSAPASNSALSRSRVDDAGPSVATILVKRSRCMPKSLLPRRRHFEVAGLLVDLDHGCVIEPPPARAGRGEEKLVRRRGPRARRADFCP